MPYGLTVEATRRPYWGAASRPPAVCGELMRPVTRAHAPISSVTADRAAVMKSTARVTYSAGWSTKKKIAFDAAI